MGNFDRQAKQIGQLMLERDDISVNPGAFPGHLWPEVGLGPPRQSFRFADRQSLGHDLVRERFDVARANQRTRVSHAQLAVDHQCLDTLGKFQQAQQIGDMTARFVNDLCQHFLAVAVIPDQPVIPLGFLDRVQILTLNIFDERDFERLGI